MTFRIKNPPPRIILVTGIPRTGTTAVGRVLALGRGARPLHEVFNEHVGMVQIERYFEFVDTPSLDRDKLDGCLRSIRTLDLKFKPGFFPNENPARKAIKYLLGGRTRNSCRLCRWDPFLRTIIWKDPFACLVSDYLSRRHRIDVLVTARNPWAVSASFKRMGWGFDLMPMIRDETPLPGLPSSMQAGIPARSDPVPNSAVLWHVAYLNLLKWAEGNPRIRFVNLDDIVDHPLESYKKTYEELGLGWSRGVEGKIRGIYNRKGGNGEPKRKKAHDRHRNLSAINTYWKGLLDEKEFDLVRDMNQALWDKVRKVCL